MRFCSDFLLIACGAVLLSVQAGCSKAAEPGPEAAADSAGLPKRPAQRREDKAAAADKRVLFIGNSHTGTHNLPKIVQKMLNRRQSAEKVYCEYFAVGFLRDLLQQPGAVKQLFDRPWDVVVLQGQVYSSSGRYDYPTTGTETLASAARRAGARVVLFPEWGRFRADGDDDPGKVDEAARIQQLHESIAEKVDADIAPVGLTWDRALKENPSWRLHDVDGNHANAQGALLTAMVLEKFLAGLLFPESANQTVQPHREYGADLELQRRMAAVAAAQLADLSTVD